MTQSSIQAPPSRTATSAPVVGWGLFGAVSCVLITVVLTRWAAAGIETVDPGPDPFGGWRLALVRFLEWSQFAALLILLHLFVVRRLLRRLEIGFDGLFILAALTLNFWDPLDNYAVFSFQYNAHMLNVRSWGEQIPGWSSGPDVWAVPVLFIFGAYTWAFFAAARMGEAIVRRLETSRPHWGNLQRFGVAYLVLAGLCAVAENVYLQSHAIANIGTPNEFTVNSDAFNGWPIYNPIFFGFAWTACAWLRWSRDADGLSAVERGASSLATRSRRLATTARFLAIFAFLQVTYIGLYFVPWNLFALMHDPAPPLPSYFPVP